MSLFKSYHLTGKDSKTLHGEGDAPEHTLSRHAGLVIVREEKRKVLELYLLQQIVGNSWFLCTFQHRGLLEVKNVHLTN